MQFFISCVLSFALVIFCPVYVFAAENPPVNLAVDVVANQEVGQTPMVEPLPTDRQVNPQPAKMETLPVVANQEVMPDIQYPVKPIEGTDKNALTITEHGFFNHMKQLAGRWEGLSENIPGEKQNKIVVVYEVTAGGNAVLERIFPGSLQEMVTMYYEEKGQLTLTHYCMIGTRSVMKLKNFTANNDANKNIFEFNLVESPGLNPALDTHMHSLKIAFLDENHMNQSWDMFEAGKLSGSYSFVLTRVPTN